MTEDEARRWPDLMAIVEERVKPGRMLVKAQSTREKWWQFERQRPELLQAIRRTDLVLVNSQVSARHSFARLPASWVFAHTLNVFVDPSHGFFAVLQSRAHEVWARSFGSSMKDDLRYTPSDCFETFPLPADHESYPALEAAGRTYYEFRAALMVKNNEGLTKTYNRFHDPDETSPNILRLRELHAAMDRAVLDAYGWTDLQPTCEFLLDYEDNDPDDDETPMRTKKKPWRYRWPDPFRDELLARLLALNLNRAEAERLGGKSKTARGGTPGKLEIKGGQKDHRIEDSLFEEPRDT
jgi:hypothetical protein